MTTTTQATVCLVTYGAGDYPVICGRPASYREGMCVHEHLRTGPLCEQHAAASLCRVCYTDPQQPHHCWIRAVTPEGPRP